jgi:hypothetical protein
LAASFPPTRPQNHDLHEGPKPKMNLQDSKASDAKTLQSQNSQNAKIRILLNALRVVHGRLIKPDKLVNRNVLARRHVLRNRRMMKAVRPLPAWLSPLRLECLPSHARIPA